MEIKVHVNADQDLKGIKNHLAKVNKKAEKYGCPPATMTVSDPFFAVIQKQKHFVKQITVEYSPVKIAGGWMVLGSVEATEGKWNIINGLVDNIGDLKQYDLSWCEHCQKKRNRKKVIILQNAEGERKIVGRQCVVEYLGIPVEHAIFAASLECMLMNIFDGINLDDEYSEKGPKEKFKGYDIELLAHLTAAGMADEKWMYRSAKYSDDGGTPNKIMLMVNKYSNGDNKDRNEIQKLMTAETNKIADDLLNELANKYNEDSINTLNNSFEYDFAVMINLGTVTKVNYFVGMFGSALAKKMTDVAGKKHDPKNSNYFGTVGEKLKNVAVEVLKVRTCQSDWGYSTMVTGVVKDTDNQFVTFINGNSDWLYDNNVLKTNLVIDATVKKHDDRGYGKQTSLIRFRLAK